MRIHADEGDQIRTRPRHRFRGAFSPFPSRFPALADDVDASGDAIDGEVETRA
jgi:hypothetical protein